MQDASPRRQAGGHPPLTGGLPWCHKDSLLGSRETPADFRTLSTAYLIQKITVNYHKHEWTQHDFYVAS